MKPLPLLKGFLFASGLLFLTFLSCKKAPYELGIAILPPTDTVGIQYSDTATVVAYSILNDSVRTDESTYGMLGAIMDPVFGETTASFYSQFFLSNEGIKFGSDAKLDSLVLVLYISGYYGDTTSLQRVRVYEMSQDLTYDSSYYSNQTAATYDIELADQFYKIFPKDSVKVYSKKDAPQIRINLTKKTNYLGNKLLSAPQDILNSNKQFVHFMKGLYVKAEAVDSKGVLMKFETSTLLPKMVVYFSNSTNGDSLHYDFPIATSAARFTHFDHFGYQDASPQLRQQVLNHDTSAGKDQLFLQPNGGIKVRLHLPYIRDYLKQGKIAVNNAQLILENVERDTVYPPPAELFMYKLDSAGNFGILPDQAVSSAFFGGTYHASTRTYTFRITKFLQNIMDNDTVQNSDLYIYAGNPLKNILETNRLVLYGTNPNDPVKQGARLKLQLIYTRLR